MSGQVVRPDLRSRLWRRARDFVARRLLREANRIWSDEPHEIDRAIEKVEQAWSLTRDPEIAVQLSTMYDQANQNPQALVVLREAFRRNPRHALVRHHAAITLLRHGTAADVRDFFDSVLKVDRNDAFAQFVVSLLDGYDGWVDELVSSIRGQQDGRQPFVISCPVWGQPFADDFVRYSCAALLSPNNLPKLAERCSIHIVIFTTAATESHLRADPLFARLSEYATVGFVRYSDAQVNYRQAMEAHYGHEIVPHSAHSLAYYYERNCKFALMSCAHYVALAAGRTTDALVSCQVADTLLNDGALTFMVDRMAGGAAAVLVNCIQMDGAVLRSVLDDGFRHSDGVIQIPSESCVKILSEHLPPYNLAGAGNLPQIPLRVCWRGFRTKASSDCQWRTVRCPSNLPAEPSHSPSPRRRSGYGGTGAGCEGYSIAHRCAWAAGYRAKNGRKRRRKLPPSSMPSSSRRPASKSGAGPGVHGVCDRRTARLCGGGIPLL